MFARYLPWVFVAFLTLGMATIMLATPFPLDDHFLYQQFTERLAAGALDLTIPGFHGSDIFAVPWYLVTRSPIAQIRAMQVWAILLPLLAFLAGKSLYRSAWHGVMLAAIIAMMPFVSFVAMRGWTGGAYWGLMLLTLYGATRASWWTGIAWALSILTKPFAIVLAPVIYALSPAGGPPQKRYQAFAIAAGIVGLYLLAQYVQAGRIFVGAHDDITAGGAIQGPLRILLNLAHSLQILFSVHNYYFPDPALTGPGNMMHTTPVLIFLGLFAMLAPRTADADTRLMRALLIGAGLGIFMNALLDHMDHFYMEASVLLFILASLPMLKKYPVWIPLTLATLHFQWFYFYLQYRQNFQLDAWFFAVPLLVDAAFFGFCLFHWRRGWAILYRS